MTDWRYTLGIHTGCWFERDNPDPEPSCGICGDCDLCDGWLPTERCHGEGAYRVALLGGVIVDACSSSAHGHPCEWSARIANHPTVDGMFIFKYFYRDIEMDSIALRPHPLIALLSRVR